MDGFISISTWPSLISIQYFDVVSWHYKVPCFFDRQPQLLFEGSFLCVATIRGQQQFVGGVYLTVLYLQRLEKLRTGENWDECTFCPTKKKIHFQKKGF